MPLKTFIFNDYRFEDLYLLQGRKKSPFSPIKRELIQYQSGFRLKKSTRDPLEISQPIGFLANNDTHFLNIIEHLTSKLLTDDWRTLKFEDEPGRSYKAILQNGIDDFEKMANYGSGTLNFVALYAEGEETYLELTSSFIEFTVKGQVKTDWTSKTTFSAAANKYTLEAEGHGQVILNYNFIAGDVLTIDYHKRKVLLNGKNLATAIALNTVWFQLMPGNIKIKASAATKLQYQERFH